MIKASIRRLCMRTPTGRAAWERLRGARWRAETAWLRCAEGPALRVAPAPVLIVGTGGSGTRVVARLVERMGVFLGARLNVAHDSEAMTRYLETCRAEIPCLWRAPADVPRWTTRELAGALLRQRRGIPHPRAPWGLKNPRAMFYLPHVHRLCPGMRLIHVVRDGRDMAFSENRFQLDVLGDIYSPALRTRLADAPVPVRAIALWSEINCAVARWGEATLGVRYLRLRFGDLCAAPVAVIEQIAGFLALPLRDPRPLLADVEPPASIGRWREQDPALLARVLAEGEPGLRAFGYVDAADRAASP
jgi:Sulfotransferase family